jgi:esterase FrsA
MPPTMAETWKHWERAAKNDAYPFNFCPYEDAKRVVEQVIPVFATDPDAFTRGFLAAGEPHEAAARAAEVKGDAKAAQAAWLRAYGCYRMARFPCMKTDNQKAAYRESQAAVLAAAKYDAVPPERIEMPFKGRAGEGDKVVGYLRRPKGVTRPAVLVAWAGIDTFKEECLHRTAPFFDAGLAVLMIDMPGTGDSPVRGSIDAERQWDAVFDWIAAQPGLDASRVGGWGGSFGGYWATKVAHTHADRFRAVISQGGGAHLAFSREQIERAQNNGLPWGQSESRGNAFGKASHAEWIEYAPSLSLLDQGVLDRDCTQLLCINGNQDPIVPIADYYLVLEHGRPKSARFVANGVHMGRPNDGSPDPTTGIMLDWMKRALGM